MRNSINLKFYKFLIRKKIKVDAFDPFVEDDVKNKYKLIKKIKQNNRYDVILFLSKHKSFEKEFKKFNKNKNRLKILDPFEYYR